MGRWGSGKLEKKVKPGSCEKKKVYGFVNLEKRRRRTTDDRRRKTVGSKTAGQWKSCKERSLGKT